MSDTQNVSMEPHRVVTAAVNLLHVAFIKASRAQELEALPLEEYEANGETIRAAVDQWLGGQDKMSTRLWWDCNPRIR